MKIIAQVPISVIREVDATLRLLEGSWPGKELYAGVDVFEGEIPMRESAKLKSKKEQTEKDTILVRFKGLGDFMVPQGKIKVVMRF